MSDGQDLLSQATVDFRDEERRHAHRLPMLDPDPAPLALCTLDARCAAEPDEHLDGCPVEERLRDELGF